MILPENCRILLVDDEEGIRFTLGYLLRKEGMMAIMSKNCTGKTGFDGILSRTSIGCPIFCAVSRLFPVR